jgi:hypothetical protein
MSFPLTFTINSSRKIGDVLPASNLLTVGYYAAAKTPSAAPVATSPTPVSPAPDSVSTLASRLDSTSISSQGGVKSRRRRRRRPPPLHAASPPPAYGLAQAEALYNYSSTDEGDLPLVAGQRITILEYGATPPLLN